MKRKILSLLVFASLAIGTTSLIGCNQNSTSGDSSSSNSFNSASLGKAKEIYCTGGPANQYNLNDIIDLSDLNIHVKYKTAKKLSIIITLVKLKFLKQILQHWVNIL